MEHVASQVLLALRPPCLPVDWFLFRWTLPPSRFGMRLSKQTSIRSENPSGSLEKGEKSQHRGALPSRARLLASNLLCKFACSQELFIAPSLFQD